MAALPRLKEHETVRAAFPALQRVVYLNVGTYGIMPGPALDHFLKVLEEFERFGVASSSGIWRRVQKTRADIARLLGCDAEQIAFTGNATDGTNLVLAGLQWDEGDEVIATHEEHESIIHPLLHLQRTQGVCMRRVEVSPDPDVMLARCEAAVSPRTRLLAFSHVTCETGTRLPAAEMCAWAAQRGVLSLVDGAQSLGVFTIDVRELGCNFYTSNGHKWLCGPKGTGVFYARPERLLELSPAHVGAGSLQRADAEACVAELWPTGHRFEYGTRASALFVGLGASLDWLGGLRWADIEGYVAGLSSYLKDCILERPYLRLRTPVAFEESSGLTTFSFVGNNLGDVCRVLGQRRIPVRGVPHYDAVRISTACFNNQGDIDTLMDALDEIVDGNGRA